MLELKVFSHLKTSFCPGITLLFTIKPRGTLSLFQNQKEMALNWIPSRSKIQTWILPKLIQFLTILQIISLIIMGSLNFPTLYRVNLEDGSWVLPQVSYYLSPYFRFFLEESEYNKILALVSILLLNVCLVYCTWTPIFLCLVTLELWLPDTVFP